MSGLSDIIRCFKKECSKYTDSENSSPAQNTRAMRKRVKREEEENTSSSDISRSIKLEREDSAPEISSPAFNTRSKIKCVVKEENGHSTGRVTRPSTRAATEKSAAEQQRRLEQAKKSSRRGSVGNFTETIKSENLIDNNLCELPYNLRRFPWRVKRLLTLGKMSHQPVNTADVEAVKRKRGRPRKSTVVAPELKKEPENITSTRAVVVKKRVRPQKSSCNPEKSNEAVLELKQEPGNDTEHPVAKKKRGRPRKSCAPPKPKNGPVNGSSSNIVPKTEVEHDGTRPCRSLVKSTVVEETRQIRPVRKFALLTPMPASDVKSWIEGFSKESEKRETSTTKPTVRADVAPSTSRQEVAFLNPFAVRFSATPTPRLGASQNQPKLKKILGSYTIRESIENMTDNIPPMGVQYFARAQRMVASISSLNTFGAPALNWHYSPLGEIFDERTDGLNATLIRELMERGHRVRLQNGRSRPQMKTVFGVPQRDRSN